MKTTKNIMVKKIKLKKARLKYIEKVLKPILQQDDITKIKCELLKVFETELFIEHQNLNKKGIIISENELTNDQIIKMLGFCPEKIEEFTCLNRKKSHNYMKTKYYAYDVVISKD
ncbi:hypothetical protein [Tenacibaculum sp. C7A-26P2]|uniref:hypothetical protein n=1 Tax=Tenacibaculum sp. C7A-26P2 TaxID=3447504 RepID=UPI003F83B276